MTPAEQAIYKGRKIPGFTQKVTEVTRPSQALYEMKVDTFLNSDKGYTESALQEIESNLPQGQTIASVIKKKQEDLKAANNGVEPTLDLVKKSLAKEHFMSMYDNWARENAVSDEFQREPVGGTGKKGDEPANTSAVATQFQYTPSGYKNVQKAIESLDIFAENGINTPEDALNIYNGTNNYGLTPDQVQKVRNKMQEIGAVVEAPTMMIQLGTGSEPVNIDGTPINIEYIYYDKNSRSFYAKTNKQVSGEGTSVNLEQNVVKISPKQMQQIQASENKSIVNQFSNWNKLAGANGWPTIGQYINRETPSGGASSSRTTTKSSGKLKKVF